MRKNALKRITAMVLVFILCTFLMADNTLGVRAATTDDLLVSDTPVTSEQPAENPDGDTEIISEFTSEEEDLNAEETTEDVSEETNQEDKVETSEDVAEETTENASEETTEDTQENSSDDDATDNSVGQQQIYAEESVSEEWLLINGTEETTYTSFESLAAGIDALNDEDGEYTIICTNTGSDYFGDIDGNWPTKAAKLTFSTISEDSQLNYRVGNYVETDIKVVFDTHVSFVLGCSLNEVEVNDATITIYDGPNEEVSQIDTLTLNGFAQASAMNETKIGTCNMQTGSLYLAYTMDENASYVGDGSFVIDTINFSGDTFSVNVGDNGYSEGDIILTTSSEISLDMISNGSSALWSMELVDNQDGTTSVKLVDSGVISFELSYGTTTEEYKTYDDVCARIDALASNETEYTILWTKEGVEANAWMWTGYLPGYAKKITFVSEDSSSITSGFGGFKLECSGTVSYPLEFRGAEVWVHGADYTDITVLDCPRLNIGHEGSYDTVTLPATTALIVNTKAEVEEIVYTGTATDASEMVFRAVNYTDNNGGHLVYPQLKVGSVTPVSTSQKIELDVQWSSSAAEDSPVFELTDCDEIWDNIDWVRVATLEGYSLKKMRTAEGAGVFSWVADTATSIKLKYGTTTEEFTDVNDAVARIDALNDATEDYTISIKPDEDSPFVDITDFPEKAKSLTLEKESGEYLSIGLADSDNQVNIPVIIKGAGISTYSDLQTKDFTIESADFCYIYNKFDVDGTFTIGDAHVLMNEEMTATTLSCQSTTSKYHVTFSYPAVVDNVDIPSGQKMKIALFGGEDSTSTLTVNNYSEDVDRITVTCEGIDGYEALKKVNDDGSRTFYTKGYECYYFVYSHFEEETYEFGRYNDWDKLLTAFKNNGNKTLSYSIRVADGYAIGALPTQAGEITLMGDDSVADPVIKCKTTALTIPTTTVIMNAKLANGSNEAPVTINLNGKTLHLENVTNIGKISGGNGWLDIYGYVEINSIEKLVTLNICPNQSLYVNGVVSNVVCLMLHGELQIDGKNAVTVNNIVAGENGQITYLCEGGVNQNVKITGSILDNDVAIVRMERTYNNGEEVLTRTNFPVGTKLLTAQKCTIDQFALDGEGMTCYKTGNDVYAGMYALELYNVNDNNNHIGTYAKWSDMIAKINELDDANAYYEVYLLEDYNIGGSMTLPAAGNCTVFSVNGQGGEKTLYYTGDISIPTYRVDFGPNLKIQALTTAGVATTSGLAMPYVTSVINVYGSNYEFSKITGKGWIYLGQNVNMTVKGDVAANGIVADQNATVVMNGKTTLNKIMLYDNASVKSVGTLKVGTIEYVSGTAKVICNNTVTVTDKISITAATLIPQLDVLKDKTITIKNINAKDGDVAVNGLHLRIVDASGQALTMAAGKVVVTTSGNLYADRILLHDKDENLVSVYRSGNNIKVQGTVKTPYHVMLANDEGTEDLGCYASLSDVNTEIGRRKEAGSIYTITVNEASLISGAFPMPKAGTYDKLIFEGESLTITGAVKLTGDVEFRNEILKQKSATDSTPVALKIELEKYTLTISEGNELTNVDSIVGKAGSVLEIKDNVSQEIKGAVSGIGVLRLDGTLITNGDVSVTNIESNGGAQLHYNLDKKTTISGVVTFDEGTDEADAKIALYPYKNGTLITSCEKDMVIIDVCSKAVLTDFDVAVDNNPYVLYKASSAVKLGVPNITIFVEPTGSWANDAVTDEIQFVTINDAIDYLNSRSEGAYGVRLENDIPNAGNIKTIQGSGKNIIITSKDLRQYDLNFGGTFTVDGGVVKVVCVDLLNKPTTFANVTLKNGADLTLIGTAVSGITAPAGTTVQVGGVVEITGKVSGACDFVLIDASCVYAKNDVTVGSLTLDGAFAEVRILTGKKFVINGEVNVAADSVVCINRVDKYNALASISAGTVMVTATKGLAGQFCTENIMKGTNDVYWLLTKSGKDIKVANLVAYVYEEGNRNEENSFASFNEAKEYILAEDEQKRYVVELLCDSSGADMTDLPANLVMIVKSESAQANVKLTTSKDVNLSGDLILDGVNLVASKKNINANEHFLAVNNGKVDAAGIMKVSQLMITNSTVTFTGKSSTINEIYLYDGGTLKCPEFKAYEPTPLG